MEIGEAIIQNLDEDGMLRVPLEDVANLGPYPIPEVEKALAVVQASTPRGSPPGTSPSACASSCGCSASRTRPRTSWSGIT